MIAFSVIRLKVGAILLDYQLFINHAPHHAPKHALNTHFAAATVSSFETTFLFYPLPFEKHIPFHKITIIWRIPRNSSFPNSWNWQNLRHGRQWPRSSINDLERLVRERHIHIGVANEAGSRVNCSAVLIFWYPVQTLYKPCTNHRHARMALVMLWGHCVCLTPISRGRVSHSDSGLNTVGGVLACPWFVNDWHSLRIMPLSDVEKKSCVNR